MPHNIPPTEEINGSASLPLARVKRIIKLDEEIGTCSNNAAFLVTVAAEMFIQYLAEQGYKGAQKDRRKNLQYKDLANAVAALDTLEFLSDTIPRTVPYKKIATERTKRVAAAAGELSAGQTTLNGRRVERSSSSGAGAIIREEDEDEERDEDEDEDEEEEEEEEPDDADRGNGTERIGYEGYGGEEYVGREKSMDVKRGGIIRGQNGNTYGNGSERASGNKNGKRRMMSEEDDEHMD